MKTIGRSDSNLPAIEGPRSLEAMSKAAPMLASEVIASSGADDDPKTTAPSTSSIPVVPHKFLPNSVSGTGKNPIDSSAPSASSHARNGVR